MKNLISKRDHIRDFILSAFLMSLYKSLMILFLQTTFVILLNTKTDDIK